jgi:methylated-DNA-[protein]-cysteine S-methyltransferase
MVRPNRNGFAESASDQPMVPSYRLMPTAWGTFGVVCDASGRLVATFLPQARETIRRMILQRYPSAMESRLLAEAFGRRVFAYFKGEKVDLTGVDVTLGAVGDFRRRVLEACRRIRHGATATYADLARACGSPGAARAVGGAMASNPLPLVIPCHRILRSDGSIGGFSSPEGPSQKERMLRLENPRGFDSIARAQPRMKRNQRPRRQGALS